MERPTVHIVEVGPRDGLQAIEQTIPTEVKIELIRRLAATGLRSIEVTSFTSSKWIPQLADHEKVMEAVREIREPSITYSVLVPNMKGFLAAVKAGAKQVGVFVSASEGFSRENNNCSIAEALARAKQVADQAAKLGIAVRGYVSCIFVCPFDGPTDSQKVLEVVEALLDMGCYEVSLGDTLGVGTPADVQRLLQALMSRVTAQKLACHFHDTYGQAVANSVAAYHLGLRVFDSSVGGLGGCPYSPGSKGNLASEDIVYTFEKMDIATGIDLNKLVRVGSWINERIGTVNSSRAGTAIYSKLHAIQPKRPFDGGKEQQLQKLPATSTKESQDYTLIKDDVEYQLWRCGSRVKVVLNRPQNGNALTKTMLSNLTIIFENLSQDRSVFQIVLTGSGKNFCTGMDLSTGGPTAPDANAQAKKAQFSGLYQLLEAIDKAPQTTIALINGPCFGGGVGLAFVCDIRLARPDVVFILSEVKLGLCPALISKFVIREWGLSIAREAMLTARPVTAQELSHVGVVHALAASADSQGLNELLDDYVHRYLRYSAPEASAKTKDLVSAAWRYTGGTKQDTIIRNVFEWMVTPSAEARVGTSMFRAGKKSVDWEELYAQNVRRGHSTSKI